MKAIHHVGITVSDLEQAIDFYHDVLGLEFSHEPSPLYEGPELGEALNVPGAALKQACFRCGDSLIELIEYTSPAPPNSSPPPPNAIGAAHVAFRVDDIELAKRELEGRGARFVSAVNTEDDGPLAGWHWVYFNDPAGNTLELVQEEYARPQERAAAIAAYERSRGWDPAGGAGSQ